MHQKEDREKIFIGVSYCMDQNEPSPKPFLLKEDQKDWIKKYKKIFNIYEGDYEDYGEIKISKTRGWGDWKVTIDEDRFILITILKR